MKRICTLLSLALVLASCQGAVMDREAAEGPQEEEAAEREPELRSTLAGLTSELDDVTNGVRDFSGEVDLVGKPDEIVVIERGFLDAGSDYEPRGGELWARVDGQEREVPVPLEHTDVKARITMHVSSVTVRQRYHNPYDGKIEAVYLFPLPQNAAVTDFLMTIGDRTIRGIIREREEAERIYKEARRQGYVASLLTQERPNIFTQKVANIEPGKRIDIEIAYFHTLRYADGGYEFVFPMVVGPRFNPPGSTDGVGAVPRGGTGGSGQKTEVSYLRPNEVSRHRISLSVEMDAAVPFERLESPSHAVEIERAGGRTLVSLAPLDRIPNRDFVLRWNVATDRVHGAFAAHRDGREGWFTLVLQPPARVEDLPRQAREMIFVVDCSGSMKGEPLAACQRAMRRCLKRLDRNDTFQIIRFSDSAAAMGAAPVPATPRNLQRGLRYVDGLRANGGTMMIRGIRAALDAPRDSERYRIVSFMTDGYIGNEQEILGAVRPRVGDARIFSFGVGNSVNRYLLEGLARAGRGVAAYVGTDESTERAVDSLYRRIEQPALTDIEIDWGALRAADVHPASLPDLFVGAPVVLAGRFRGDADATITVRGKMGGRTVELPVRVRASDRPAAGEALAKLWARARIASLHQAGDAAAIRDTALQYGLVSSFTAFVAVDSSRRTEGDHGTTVPVPVPVPEGTRYETTVR